MKQETLKKLFEEHKVNELAWEDTCKDCGMGAIVIASMQEDGQIGIDGGAVYQPDPNCEDVYIKCDSCFIKNPILTGWRKTEVYSRIVGYMRPLQTWNNAKAGEFKMRKEFLV